MENEQNGVNKTQQPLQFLSPSYCFYSDKVRQNTGLFEKIAQVMTRQNDTSLRILSRLNFKHYLTLQDAMPRHEYGFSAAPSRPPVTITEYSIDNILGGPFNKSSTGIMIFHQTSSRLIFFLQLLFVFAVCN